MRGTTHPSSDVIVSPSTRDVFGITDTEAMAAGCTVIGANHPESAANEVIGDARLLAQPTVDGVTDALQRPLVNDSPTVEPTTAVERYDWDSVAAQAESVYRRVIAGQW